MKYGVFHEGKLRKGMGEKAIRDDSMIVKREAELEDLEERLLCRSQDAGIVG